MLKSEYNSFGSPYHYLHQLIKFKQKFVSGLDKISSHHHAYELMFVSVHGLLPQKDGGNQTYSILLQNAETVALVSPHGGKQTFTIC